MNIPDIEKEILNLFHALDDDMHHDLAYLWKHKDELPVMEADVETLEEHVLRLLKILPGLKKSDYKVYKANCEHLIRYLKHPKASKEWANEIKELLDIIIAKTNDAVQKGRQEFWAKRRQTNENLVNLVRLIVDFYRSLNLDIKIVEERLKARGLGCLWDGIYKNSIVPREIILKNGAAMPFDQILVLNYDLILDNFNLSSR